MKILIDYGFFRWQKFGGISRYHYELAKRLKKNNKVKIGVLFNRNYYLSQITGKIWRISESKKLFRILNGINKIYNIMLLKFNNYDIFHPTSNSDYFLNYLKETKLVITIHDMIDEKLEKIFPENIVNDIQKFIENGEIWDYKKNIKVKKNIIYKADRIIAISENTKKDILEIYPDIIEEKIEVIYHGNFNKKEKYCEKKEKYLLYVGARNFLHKNFKNLIYSLENILKVKDLKLICAGGGKFTEKEKELFLELGLENKIIQKDVADQELEILYMRALLFISPSLYEGFGLPLLEAMNCGCPMIISETSCYPEIAGEASFYFNPYDMKDMENKILNILEDYDNMTKNQVMKGYQRIKEFNLDKMANETLRVYEKVSKKN